jgi:hypothetical protein
MSGKREGRPSRKPPSRIRRDPIYIPATETQPGAGLEWNALRVATFDELRGRQIPENLIEAVRAWRLDAVVTYMDEEGKVRQLPQDLIKTIRAWRLDEFMTWMDGAHGKSDELSLPGQTASDSLARCLRRELRELRRAGGAPVRSGKMIARSTISAVAIDMLETHHLVGHTPGQLVELIKELLEADKPKLAAPRKFAARDEAAWALAQDASFSTRELARTLGVEASSVSRWQRDPRFRGAVQRRREWIEDLKRLGIWPGYVQRVLIPGAGIKAGQSEVGAQSPNLAEVERAIGRRQESIDTIDDEHASVQDMHDSSDQQS